MKTKIATWKEILIEKSSRYIEPAFEKLFSNSISSYLDSESIIEMIQALVDRYDEAFEALAKKAQSERGLTLALENDLRLDLEKIQDLMEVLFDAKTRAFKLNKELSSRIKALERKSSDWSTYSLILKRPFEGIVLEGFKIHDSINLTMSNANSYIKVYIDGRLMPYGIDYFLNGDSIVFVPPVPEGSHLQIETVKNTN
jgi:hypothetical protein